SRTVQNGAPAGSRSSSPAATPPATSSGSASTAEPSPVASCGAAAGGRPDGAGPRSFHVPLRDGPAPSPSPSPSDGSGAGVRVLELTNFATPKSRLGPTTSAMIVPLVPVRPSFSQSRRRSSPTTMMLSPLRTQY